MAKKSKSNQLQLSFSFDAAQCDPEILSAIERLQIAVKSSSESNTMNWPKSSPTTKPPKFIDSHDAQLQKHVSKVVARLACEARMSHSNVWQTLYFDYSDVTGFDPYAFAKQHGVRPIDALRMSGRLEDFRQFAGSM